MRCIREEEEEEIGVFVMCAFLDVIET